MKKQRSVARSLILVVTYILKGPLADAGVPADMGCEAMKGEFEIVLQLDQAARADNRSPTKREVAKIALRMKKLAANDPSFACLGEQRGAVIRTRTAESAIHYGL